MLSGSQSHPVHQESSTNHIHSISINQTSGCDWPICQLHVTTTHLQRFVLSLLRTRFKKSFKECEINREIVCSNMVYKTLFRAVSCQKNYSWKRCKCSIGLPSRFFFLFISFRRRSRKCRSLDFLPKEIRRLATQEKRMRCSKRILSSRRSECAAS